MRAAIYLLSHEELKLWSDVECILAVKEFSRRGTLDWESACALALAAKEKGLSVSFEWDALMEEPRFRALTSKLRDFPKVFDAIRVRDAGAIWWARENLKCDIHLLLEAGHHNQLAIESWKQRLGNRLKRVALSPELPLSVIRTWRVDLGIPLEVMALGPLLLFHSPRPLLSSLASAGAGDEWIAEGASEESPHKGFPLQENAHGTLMFHPKDLCVLERWSEMEVAGVDFARIDHRLQSSVATLVANFVKTPGDETREALKLAWNREWMRGYWDVNKSDVLFSKLKNQHLCHDERLCAEVLEGKRESWLAVRVRGAGLQRDSVVSVINPKGEVRSLKLSWLKDDAFNPVESLGQGQVGFIPWSSGAPSRSKLHSV
jgi:putative protease